MSVVSNAGPSKVVAGSGIDSGDAAQGWANVRPLDRTAAGAVGEWVDLLARISHDLRTPLNAVIGFSDVMQQELFGPLGHARYQEYVRHIRASGVELLQAAEDALAMTALLAEPKSAVMEETPLEPALHEALDEWIGPRSIPGASVEIAVADGLEVRTDRAILVRAVRQLASIALGRVGVGGRVLVSAECEHGLIDLRFEARREDGQTIPMLASGFEPGLGRRDLAVWLATAMLDVVDCRLSVECDGQRLVLRTTLEQSIQCSFFQGRDHARA